MELFGFSTVASYFIIGLSWGVLTVILMSINEYESTGKTGLFENDAAETWMCIFFMILLSAALWAPILAWMFVAYFVHAPTTKSINQSFGLWYKFFFVRMSDYIAIFMPVACVLTLFLLD